MDCPGRVRPVMLWSSAFHAVDQRSEEGSSQDASHDRLCGRYCTDHISFCFSYILRVVANHCVAGHNVYIYNHLDNMYRDPNLTAECLWRTLKHVEDKVGVLPPNLYLQFDNSSRENRNNTIFSMLSWWVEQGAFQEIEVRPVSIQYACYFG
jgi:hypothetical protein